MFVEIQTWMYCLISVSKTEYDFENFFEEGLFQFGVRPCKRCLYGHAYGSVHVKIRPPAERTYHMKQFHFKR